MFNASSAPEWAIESQTLQTALQYASRPSSFWVIYNLSVHFVHHSVTECGKPNVSF